MNIEKKNKLVDECRTHQEYWFKNWAKANKKAIDLQYKIDKALKKINNMFDEGNENKVIDDLLELERILKGDK